jgi:mannosyltransferase OCH1-like enzyme
MNIPRLIHQSWKNAAVPNRIYPDAWRTSWRELQPRWDYKFWTDAHNRELVERTYPQFLNFYDSLDAGIKRADFSRFLYMHRFGGVYVDLDFICLRELTPLLYGASIVVGQLSKDNFHYRIPNAFMASEPGLDFWLALATDAMNAPQEEQGVERLAGPLRLQQGLLKYKPAGLRVLEQHLVYPLDWIHLTNWREGTLFRQNEHDLALRMHTMDLESARKEFPQSFAVTTWSHNW